MTFIYTLQKGSMQFRQMKGKLLQHMMIQFYQTLTTCSTKRTLLITPFKKQINVSFAMSLAEQRNDFQNVVLCTGDTDVLVLLISLLPLIPKIKSCNIICKFGIRDNQKFYNVVLLSKELGDNVSKALPFFHGFTGCDTFSSFYNRSKLLFFDAAFSEPGWLEHIKQSALRSDVNGGG